MPISVILAHPDTTSFNHAIAETTLNRLRYNGYDVIFHDLYAEGFDPLLATSEIARDAQLTAAIERHCQELAVAEGIIVIHPNWWGQPPAILKGWVDRVIRPGVAYEFLEGDTGEGVPCGLLRAKNALVFNTSNTSTEREQEVFADPLETIWKNCIFDLCGVAGFYRRMFNIIVVSTADQRRAWLQEVTQTIDDYFPMVS